MKIKSLITFLFFVSFSVNIFAQGTWTQKANFGGTARVYAVGFSIGTKGYIGLGGDNNQHYNDFWEWDQVTNTWTQKANFNGAVRFGAVAFSIGSKGYIGLGKSSSFYNDFWEWDQAINTWTQKTNFPGTGWSKRVLASGFSIGKKGYIGLGLDTVGNYYRDFWEWDGDISSSTYNTWTQKAIFSGIARYGAVGFSTSTKGYIGVGDNPTMLYSDFWEWDQATDAWTQKANYPGNERVAATGFSIGNNGYIGTGCVDVTSPGTNKFWVWNSTINSWIQKANFNGVGRFSAVGFSIGTKGYIGTGSDTIPNYLNDFWEYTPDTVNGINEINISNLITNYPNPTSGKFTVTISPAELGSASVLTLKQVQGDIVIYNLQGEKVYSSSNFQISKSTIDLSSQPSGVYFLKVQTSAGEGIKKLIIQK